MTLFGLNSAVSCGLAIALSWSVFAAGCESDGGDPGPGDAVGDSTADVTFPDFGVELDVSTLSGNAPLAVSFVANITGIDASDVTFAWFVDDVANGTGAEFSSVFYRAGAAEIEVRATYLDIASGQSKTESALTTVRILACGELTWGKVTLSSPTEVGPGGDFSFESSELRNEGDLIEDDFDVVVGLSTSETWDPATGYEVFRETVSGMASGLIGEYPSIDFSQRTFSVGSDVPTDVYFVHIIADPDGVVNECQKINNQKASTNALTIDETAGLKPDLVLSNLKLPADFTAHGGETIQYKFTITNQGVGEAKRFRHAFWLSTDNVLEPDQDVVVASAADEGSRVNKLGPGESLNFFKGYTMPDDLADGEYYLLGVVDVLDDLAEDNEENNFGISNDFLTMRYEAPECFDLAFAEIDIQPLSTYWDGSIQLTATITNPGTQATPDDWTLRAFLSIQPSLNPSTSTPAGEWLLDRIPAGQTRSFDFVVPISDELPVLDHYVGALVDPDNALVECDESNNAGQFGETVKINAIASVDLVMGDIAYHPSAVAAGEVVKLEYDISNTGTSGATAFKVGFVLSPDATITRAGVASGQDILIGTAIQSSVPATDSIQRIDDVLIPIALNHRDTDYYLGVIADIDGIIGKDSNVGNNVGVADTVLVVSGAQGGCYEDANEDNDGVTQATILAPGLYEGLGSCGNDDWYAVEVPQHHSLTVQVSSAPILAIRVPSHDVKVDLVSPSGDVVSTALVTTMGEVQTFVVPEAGTWFVRVAGDGLDDRAVYTVDVSVTPPVTGVDLVAYDVDVSPVSIYPGGAMSVGWRQVNGGQTPAASHIARVWLSRDETLSLADDTAVGDVVIDGLAPLTIADVVSTALVPTTMDGGDWYVILQVDADDDVVEAVESNNIVVADSIFLDASLACLDDDLEPNDSLNYATPVQLVDGAATVSGQVVCPELDDWFAIDLVAGQALQITGDYEFNSLLGQLELQLWDGVSTEPLMARYSSTAPTVELPYVGIDGTYYLRASARAVGTRNGPKTYTLTIDVDEANPNDVCVPDAYENNGAVSVAPALGCGLLEGTLCNADFDYYLLPGEASLPVSVTIANEGGQVRARLYVDPDGAPVAARSGNGSLTYTPDVDGPLYLKVDPRSGPLSMTSFDYTLDIDGVPGVDLTVTAPEISVDTVFQGDDVFVSYLASNGCIEPASTFDTAVWLSTDRVRDGSDVPLVTVEVTGGLGAGEGFEFAQKVAIPTSTLPGDYYVLVEADSGGTILESNEVNNIGTTPLSVAKLCLPDAYEPNDVLGDPATAPLLGTNGLSGAAACPFDQDWFMIQAPAGITVRVAARFSHDEGDLDLSLYDGAYSTTLAVASSKSSDDDEEIFHPSPLVTTYFLRVAGFGGASAEYSLELEFVAP